MRDLRLALPVAIAWAVLAGVSPHAEALGTAAIVSALAASARLGAYMMLFSLSVRIWWVGEMRPHGCGRIGSIKSG